MGEMVEKIEAGPAGLNGLRNSSIEKPRRAGAEADVEFAALAAPFNALRAGFEAVP
jgi:hypothetical protein